MSYTFCPDRPRSGCEVKIDVPDSCEPPAAGTPSLCPVVFYLNGAGGSNRWTSRVRPRPDDGLHVQGLIGVYPLGDSDWNTGPRPTNRCAFTDYDCTSDPDEPGFVADIISYLREQGAGGNVYVVGGSNGGALAHRLAANAGPELLIKGIVAKVSQLLATPYMSGPGQLNHNRPGNGIGPFSNGDLPVVTGRDSEKVSVLSVTSSSPTTAANLRPSATTISSNSCQRCSQWRPGPFTTAVPGPQIPLRVATFGRTRMATPGSPRSTATPAARKGSSSSTTPSRRVGTVRGTLASTVLAWTTPLCMTSSRASRAKAWAILR